MFADDTNLFYSHKEINALFLKVNNELHKTNQWFISNKISLSIKKSKYSFFHKRSKKGIIILFFSKLKINNHEIEQAGPIKFVGITWKSHIKHIENKVAKNIGLLFKAKSFLNKQSLLSNYSYIHSYMSYTDVYGAMTNVLKEYLQAFTKYLRQTLDFVWNNPLRENLKLYFSGDIYR